MSTSVPLTESWAPRAWSPQVNAPMAKRKTTSSSHKPLTISHSAGKIAAHQWKPSLTKTRRSARSIGSSAA